MSQDDVQVINPTGPLPGGIDSFAEVVRDGCCWVDKSPLIEDAITCDKKVMLITRPRRFGKTINLSLLRYFFDNAPPGVPFQDVDIASHFSKLLIGRNQEIMRHQGQYPVIHMTFKGVKAPTWEEAYEELCSLVHREITRHKECRDFHGKGLEPDEEASLERILSRSRAKQSDWRHSLELLCKLLTLHHKRPTWLLLDEYDRPIHEAYIRSKQQGEDIRRAGSYYDKMASFMSNFLGEALKGNDFLFRSVVTGILRVAKEDIFSGVNNLGVYGVLDDRFANRFGFTQAEVDVLLRERGLEHRAELVRTWYDGYRFGEDEPARVYNPWSVISYLGHPSDNPKAYWVNSGGIGLLHRLLDKSNARDRQDLESLLLGGTIEREVSDSMPLRELENLQEALWSVTLTSGYVTAQSTRLGVLGRKAVLRVPNGEVRLALQQLARAWLNGMPRGSVSPLLEDLLRGNVEGFARRLDVFARASLSYFDIQPGEPEWVYHILLLGILSHVVDEYRVRSNRESGDGRPDILLIPVDQNLPGVIMEFKQTEEQDDLAQAAQAALDSCFRRNDKGGKDYGAEFADHPPKGVLQLGIGFCGKRTHVCHRWVGRGDQP